MSFLSLFGLAACVPSGCQGESPGADAACLVVTALRDPEIEPETDEVDVLLSHANWLFGGEAGWEDEVGLWCPGVEDVRVRVSSNANGVYCEGTEDVDLEPYEHREIQIQTSCTRLSE